jgi:hypothetical protein
VADLGGGAAKPDFAESISNFSVKVIDGFPEDAGTVGPGIGYDLCSVEVDAAFRIC